ncbi:MAG: rhomboid family intramembrane serine protease [Gammaproteobacteria bacterium]|nr:rhomboid family intramembrane serine protease [Gammaproteobacteria bacterium]MDH5304947.1 rhomboid family intramembrane serine protease [Gammaproteobacteria bacterium]MDH5321727.1 rhomboid family intramembrane serine protease [Gammaproteobacteria bacterium]
MNSPIYNMRPRRQGSIPDVVFVLLVANGLLYALERFSPNFMIATFGLWPVDSGYFRPWQLLTYGFLHDVYSLYHIGFNMLGLWMFGRHIEPMMGTQRFITYYLTCVVGAGFIQLLVAGLQGGEYYTVGASGGLMGILLAYAIAFPNQTIMLLIPPIPMKAKYFVLLFALASLVLGVSGRAAGVAHFAHLGGMLFGFLLLNYWNRPRRRG